MSGSTKKVVKKRGSPRKKAKSTKFKPTEADRERVSVLIAAGVKSETARLMVKNPKTGRAVARSTFWIAFKRELEDGVSVMNGKAAATLNEAMDARDEDGNVTRTASSAAMFWLKTRNSELFSERHINENIDRTAGSMLDKIDPSKAARVAQIVLDQAEGELKIKEKRPSINDEPAGTA